MNASDDQLADARVRVHATFTASTPIPIFVVAVEVLEGVVRPDMLLQIPLNSTLDVTLRIASVEHINNSLGLPLRGLCIQCNDDETRQLVDALNIIEDILVVSQSGEDQSAGI